MWKKRYLELLMACLMLACFYILSRKAAYASKSSDDEKTGQMTEAGQRAEIKRQMIVIDAGHGGADPGMIGVGHLEEKGINLSIALKLRSILEGLGYQICLTRENDQGLYDADSPNKKAQDMERRIELIREKAPVLTISIHQNSFQDPRVCGPQVFYLEGSAEGAGLAKYIQNCLNEKLEVVRPRTEKGNTTYYLLKKSPVVLTIVECGFLTNPTEANLLQSEEYQTKVASAIADGIQDYLEDPEKIQNEDHSKK